uniref:Uncharacterized protein n=1 Tax=Carsonella ruddii TaxID=114186 RepID=Q9AHW7_CARRU|nr:unknown [Candidatus Carsonella ruddii]
MKKIIKIIEYKKNEIFDYINKLSYNINLKELNDFKKK